MSSRSYERRTERATAEEVAEVERQLWEFAKRIDPPDVPEAELRPGAYLWRIYRAWHSLGRGTGLASHSFRALRDELLRRDPPVRNAQGKISDHKTPLSHADAEQLIDVMLETWHLEKNRSGKWQARPLFRPNVSEPAGGYDLEAIRENLLHTLFKGDDHLLLEEPVGVPPEIFFEQRGKNSLALIIPTKGETAAHLSPTNLYGGFSNLVGRFFDAAKKRETEGERIPLLIWVLRLRAIRNSDKFHTSFHSLVAYSGCLTNWRFRLREQSGTDLDEAEKYWRLILRHSAFVVHGLPNGEETSWTEGAIDNDLAGVEADTFLPDNLPERLSQHRHFKRHHPYDFGINVSVELPSDTSASDRHQLKYWLFPDRPSGDLEETAYTTGLSVFDAEMSPGRDFDIAFSAIYEAVAFQLGFANDQHSRLCLNTLSSMGWQILDIETFQERLLTPKRKRTK